jgi:hypothetical protein
MPEFDLIPVVEAKKMTAMQRQRRILDENAPFIDAVLSNPGMAGRLLAGEGEHPLKIRERLYRAIKVLGITLTIRRTGQYVCFWREEKTPPATPRRTRRRRQQTGEIQPPSNTESFEE